MELSQKDKKLLFGGRCKLFTICARKKAKERVNELIAEADQLLVTYSAVDYNNFGVALNADANVVEPATALFVVAKRVLVPVSSNSK